METGDDIDLKMHPTTIVDETDLSKSGKKLDHSSSSSSDSSSEHSISYGAAHEGCHGIGTADDGGVLEAKLLEPPAVQESKAETHNFDDMIRLDSSSSSETEKYPAESSKLATLQEINSLEMKPADSNQKGLAIGQENHIDTSSEEDDHPLNYFEVKYAISPSQSEVSCHNKVQVDVIDQQLQATNDQNESLSTSSFRKKPKADVSEADFSPRKMPIYSLSASSSSDSDSDSSNEEHFQIGSKETSKSSIGNTDSLEPKVEKKLASNLSDDDIPISSMPSEGHSPTQSPPLQVMERIEDPSSSPYRIPSHIFTRNKSSAPTEWSAASNESLFSIHMGNTSFSRDQLCWLGKSGELCKPGEAIAPPSAELSSSQSPSFKPKEIGKKSADLDEEPVVTEATAAETMREVIRESAENRTQQNTVLTRAESRSANLSQRSDGSTKSFAFPILTGDGEKSVSSKRGAEKQKQHSQSPPQSQPPSQPSSQPTTPKNSNAVPTSKSTKLGFHMKCFSCLSCCPFSFRK